MNADPMESVGRSLGICLGASTVGMVWLAGDRVDRVVTRTHEGNPRKVLLELLKAESLPSDLRVAVTGRGLKERLELSTLSEPEAVEEACRYVLPEGHPYRIVVSAGGETTMAYHLDRQGRVQSVHTGNKCASGTGEFFLQQLTRMGITLDETAEMASDEEVHAVSGRCSVFCKSDCTHALNKGVPRPQVVGGLARMMAGKILELVGQLPEAPVLLVGGCARNQLMVQFLRSSLPDLHVPDEAAGFEALGAALWARRHETVPLIEPERIFGGPATHLQFLEPLAKARGQVRCMASSQAQAEAGDRVIVGLDVGSTTTKGTVMRRRDRAVLVSEYLRTEGDPVGAARRVYTRLAGRLEVPVVVEGLGVTGSGRRIAGLHGMTHNVVNEIIAHAAAAAHYEPEVDTIFEIGGQDAKYTHLANGVPVDYAMNEACSAGTGSFLEESARESLGLEMESIGPTALRAERPPDFSDQCAAFIGSDIKTASQAGVPVEDIVAGLVYSVARNYIHRVKGNRPVGKKILVQGGVCYNEAVPVALAALTGQSVVVPPDPGLTGAFGVALVVERRLQQGLTTAGRFDLQELSRRELTYGKSFTCPGGKEKCDLGCRIARVQVDGRSYPFGGICNRFDSAREGRGGEGHGQFNLVRRRQRRLFRDLAPEDPADTRPTVGMNRSLFTHTWFPFFNRLFAELGFRTVLPSQLDEAGLARKRASFCYPVELAHGYASALLQCNPEFFFLPHIKGLPAKKEGETSCTCVLSQGEPFYLKAAFPEFSEERTLAPSLDFTRGPGHALPALREMARKLGADPERMEDAVRSAGREQEQFVSDIQRMGEEELAALDAEPDARAVVLFGRPYNAFAEEANKGIPAKFASRGIRIIPYDALPVTGEDGGDNMYWALGRDNLQAARVVQRHPRLFGAFISNFSCGPDSFVMTYFRDIMGRKPSLALELDGHTADAGIETRIEAFLDILEHVRAGDQVPPGEPGAREGEHSEESAPRFRAACLKMQNGRSGIRDSAGDWYDLRHPRVNIAVPAMGSYSTRFLARSFSRSGVKAQALPPADEEVLKLGRGNSSCKECLPLQTTMGSMLDHLSRRPEGEITAFFMPTAEGPCRFGQYNVFSRRLIAEHRIPDAAVLSPNSRDSYGGLGNRWALAAWRAIVLGDLLYEMHGVLLANAGDPEAALAQLGVEAARIEQALPGNVVRLFALLGATARRLAAIPLQRPLHECPRLSLVGEIYVRHDPIALQGLVESFAGQGFIVRTSPLTEWVNYTDWIVARDSNGANSRAFRLRRRLKYLFESAARRILGRSGLLHDVPWADPEPLIRAGRPFVSPELDGEAILTVGAAFDEILQPSCGVIAIAPFGCLPNRLAESILTEKFTVAERKRVLGGNGGKGLGENRKLPFLAIESDGKAFPQLIQARLEAFALQARRVHEEMRGGDGSHPAQSKAPGPAKQSTHIARG